MQTRLVVLEAESHYRLLIKTSSFAQRVSLWTGEVFQQQASCGISEARHQTLFDKWVSLP